MHRRPPAALFAAAPVLLVAPALGPCKTELVLVDTDCVDVRAFDVERTGGGVSASGGSIEKGSASATGEPCPGLQSGEVTFYREENGVPGYQGPEDVAGSDPPLAPDGFVSHLEGEVAQATGEITIGSFSSSTPQTGQADAWEVNVVDADGGASTFSGTF